mgnify:CR=1 FL=1
MEIIFNKLEYIENKSSSLQKIYLNELSLIIESGSIVSFIGDDLSIIGKLITVLKRPTKGEIKIDDVVIKRTTHINNVKYLRKNIGFVYCTSEKKFLCKTVKSEIEKVMKNYEYRPKNGSKHIVDSLKMVGLSADYLDLNPEDLSTTEQNKVLLACVLSYNPQILILDYFLKGMSYKDKEYFKKIFLKLKNKFDKTIIVLDNDISNTFDFVEKNYIIDHGKLKISGGREIYYNDNLYKYTKVPPIVDFIKYVKKQGHNISEYTDIKELIKELYRNVK